MTSHRQVRAGVGPGATPAQEGNTVCKSRTEYPHLAFNVDKFPAFLPRFSPRPSVGDADGMRPISFSSARAASLEAVSNRGSAKIKARTLTWGAAARAVTSAASNNRRPDVPTGTNTLKHSV